MPTQIDNELRTGYATIDTDHELLVDLVHELLTAVDRGELEPVKTALRRFIAKVVAHFELEDGLMATVRYPQAKEHQEAHASYLKDLRQFEAVLHKDGVSEPFKLWARGRLISWFQLHIRAHDITLARALTAPPRR